MGIAECELVVAEGIAATLIGRVLIVDSPWTIIALA